VSGGGVVYLVCGSVLRDEPSGCDNMAMASWLGYQLG
jgi:hypothetical protein